MISLAKGQSVNLSKESSGLEQVRMGLGWDAVQKKKGWFGGGTTEIDLDASCIAFDASGTPLDAIWFRQLSSTDGSIRHSGDNRTGEGDGDDETISVDLTRLPAQITDLVFVVNSFTGQNFNEVENAVARLVDDVSDKELARFELREKGSHTGVVMAVVSRRGGDWTMKAIGSPAAGRTVQDLVGNAKAAL